jgi:mRNA interferase MazF
MVGCPITSRAKGYPFEVTLSPAGRVTGVVLADQVESLDWRQRNAEFAEDVALATTKSTRDMIAVLLQIEST